jgi:hypothetical protein
MMDDLNFLGNPTPDNIFGNAANFNDYNRSLRPLELQDAGLKCELKHIDSVFDSKGKRIRIRGGSRLNLDRDHGTDRYQSALVRTTIWDKDGEENGVELEIRSPHMKAALKAIVPQFENASIHAKHLTLQNEPMCLFHFRNELFIYGSNLPANSDAQQHISFLLEYMNQELSQELYTWMIMVELEASFADRAVEFQNLWMAFVPGELIYAPAQDPESQPAVLKFTSMTLSCRCRHLEHMSSHRWSISGCCIDHDGHRFGLRRTSTILKYYSGYKPLKDLAVVPLRFHADEASIKATHLQRGRKFTQLQGQHHLVYRGIAMVLGNDRNYTIFGEEAYFPLQATWVRRIVLRDSEQELFG